nr:L-glutamine:2-deoxy-scyllo-inosose aminotransferase [Escherichia coli]
MKFVDIDINTLNIDIESLKEAVTDSTKAILTVNLLGNPNNFDEINKIIGGRDIILLEDNCESMGATFNNKCAGTFGLMGTFSSFYSHHIATMEGDALSLMMKKFIISCCAFELMVGRVIYRKKKIKLQV